MLPERQRQQMPPGGREDPRRVLMVVGIDLTVCRREKFSRSRTRGATPDCLTAPDGGRKRKSVGNIDGPRLHAERCRAWGANKAGRARTWGRCAEARIRSHPGRGRGWGGMSSCKTAQRLNRGMRLHLYSGPWPSRYLNSPTWLRSPLVAG